MSSQENVKTASGIEISQVDFADSRQAQAAMDLLDEYARSEYGGGLPLAAGVQQALPGRLQACPTAVSAMAWQGAVAVGLVNCFETLSTFKARPILNIHDLAVTADRRGEGIGGALLRWVEHEARQRGCCKLTLEVLEGNRRARAVYQQFGFSGYELDPALGQALFWEKPLA